MPFVDDAMVKKRTIVCIDDFNLFLRVDVLARRISDA